MALREIIEQATNRTSRNVWGVRLSYLRNDAASAVTLRATDGEALTGIFDSAHEMIEDTGDGFSASMRRPVLDVTLEDLGFTPAAGDRFTISEAPHSGETYTVVDVQFTSAQSAKLICVAGNHSN